MSKSKPSSAAKASKSDALTKVKGAAVAKPAQSVKSKSKEIAKKVANKEDKKAKKVPVKEPTPEPSSDESSEEESESESESESEVETKKTNGVKRAAKDESSDESESDSDESASEDEAPKPNGTAAKAAKPVAAKAGESDSEESDDASSDGESSEESSDEEGPAGVKAAAPQEDDDSSDESDSDDEEEAVPKVNGAKAAATDDSDESEDSDESDAEVETKSAKRKAEDSDAPAAKKSKVPDVDTSRGPNLFVGNLSWNIDEDWLRQEFEEFGELSGVRLMTDRETGRSKGFGYIEFVSAVDAANAHSAKQGAELDGRVMNVDFANARPSGGDRQDNRRKSYGDQPGEPSDTLFLGNLSFDCSQEDISDAFGPHGTVMGVRLPTDRETGAPKGFGYVTFASVEEATGALEAMQGGYLKNRPVRLDYSQPRQQNGDSPARGGFGGRGRGGQRGGFGGRGRGGGRGDFGGRGGGRGGGFRGGRGGSTNRGGFGDFSGKKTTF